MSYLQDVFEYFDQLPLLIQIVWSVGFVLFQIILVLIIYLKILRTYLRRNEETVEKFQSEYEHLLINYLYTDSDSESSEQKEIINRLKVCVNNKFKRDIVVSILLKLRNEISGEMVDAIQKLYIDSGLVKYALIKLKSKNWYIVAKGIRELTQFKIKEAHDEVVIHLDHPKPEVSKEAQLYLISLFHFEELEYLKNVKSQLSEWDQIQLLEVLQKFDNQELPDITPLLMSENESVVSFALKLTKIYNLYDMKDELMILLTHESKEIRVQVIEILNHLYIIDAKSVLKTNFKNSSEDEQIAFINMLNNTFEVEDEPFLLENLHHTNFDIKLSVLKILKIINIDKFKSLKQKLTQPEFNQMIEFVENN
ncbi:hypothetical protein [Lutibacter sp. B1]|uniref:hypothetical protein n=1 Tax=Lutibacter sp. B1 TaxID=2725996 RepID=UPI00145742BA|nr:hypothetical protein [Lutibacter sp. B1]NLP56651.1 hypothetical protein [Lutibacter sp. B1]